MSNLRSLRKRLRVTQAELADALGLSQGAVSHCERGKQEISPEIARRLIRFASLNGIAITFDDIYGDIVAHEGRVDIALAVKGETNNTRRSMRIDPER